MKPFLYLLILLLVLSCTSKQSNTTLKNGMYRATLTLTNTEVLPFNFKVTSANTLQIFNADEVIDVTEIAYKNDSVYIQTPVFNSYIVAKINNNNLLGRYVKNDLNRVVPFKATYNNNTRFKTPKPAQQNVQGNWETDFSFNSKADAYKAKGVFTQNGNTVTGTFLTTTGDYRFLEGSIIGDSLKLSAFDGAHAFLFTAKVTDTTMQGTFYSGNHWQEPFKAKKNPNFKLPNANTLTYLKPGYNAIDFSFPNENGTMVNLTDKQFKNKVVVVQIMGTWCPNCLDESRYYSEFYKTVDTTQFEIIGLAFEYAKTQQNAFNSIKRLRESLQLQYPILLAQTGTTSKTKANEKLPMLNQVLSYPTSIFIDKKGNVRKIHTGFNGPATGKKYTEFKTEFETFIHQLIKE